MNFDLISDVHLDEILGEKTITDFVKEILPDNKSKILVFAGDFGYENTENYLFLKELKKYYEHIIYVYGNNDLKYPLQRISKFKQYKNVKERVDEFEKMISNLKNVHRLNGTTITIDGITFAGSDIFYDFDDLKKQFSFTDKEIIKIWQERKLDLKHKGWIDNPKTYAESEKEKLRQIIPNADVIITHGPPNYFVEEGDKAIGFFRFEASEFISKIQSKIWCFGHVHERFQGEKHGCLFHNASYLNKNSINNKIKTISIP